MIYQIDSTKVSDKDLKEFHTMMFEAIVQVKTVSHLACETWTMVLKELEARGLIQLVSGSFDDVGNMLVRQLW